MTGGKQARQRHDREAVVRAALGILDRDGLADLTMRRLAAELEVQPSALYWHFSDKQHVLAAVCDLIVADITWPREGTQRERVRSTADSARAVLLAHRDGAELVASSLALGLDDGSLYRRLLEAVGHQTDEDAAHPHAASAVLHFVLGHVQHEQQRRQAAALGIVLGEELVRSEAAFEAGVELLIEGIASSGR